MLNEGVKYIAPMFKFDFIDDDKEDIIKLNGSLKSSEVFDSLYFFQYEFEKNVPSKTRSDFIHALKFNQDIIGKDNIGNFINKSLVNLNKAINLSTVDVVIYPQSSSSLTKDIVDKIDYFTDADKYIKLELVKKQVSEINFNWDKFDKYCELKAIPSNTKKIMLGKMNRLLDEIHSLDYFSIAKNIKDQKYKRFLKNIYKFYDDNSINLIKNIKNKKILIIDDICTSGTTIEQIIKAYQMLDPDDSNVLVIFTLIGKSFENA
jgi:phosphoribosylpyrophosphate synthetase